MEFCMSITAVQAAAAQQSSKKAPVGASTVEDRVSQTAQEVFRRPSLNSDKLPPHLHSLKKTYSQELALLQEAAEVPVEWELFDKFVEGFGPHHN